jgi:BolA protein
MSRKARIEQYLIEHFTPYFCQVEDESHKHHVPTGSESHFTITVVCTQFESISLVNRHRLVNALLAEELNSGLHALSMHLFTPTEWQKKAKIPPSPACKDCYEK